MWGREDKGGGGAEEFVGRRTHARTHVLLLMPLIRVQIALWFNQSIVCGENCRKKEIHQHGLIAFCVSTNVSYCYFFFSIID